MRHFIAIMLLCALVSIAQARDYFATQSREYSLRGTTVIDVPAGLVKRMGEARAVEHCLEQDNRYYNLIHFISAYFQNNKLDSFARGDSFKSEAFRKMDDGRYAVQFVGEIGGRLDLIEKMEKKGLFRTGHRFLAPMPVDVDSMSEHAWYDFKPSEYDGEVVNVPVSIREEKLDSGDVYPDYKRLFEDGVLTISVFYGYDGGDGEDPGGNDLVTAKEFYTAITQEARRLNFSDPVDEHFGRIKNSTVFTRTILVEGREVEVRLKLFYRKSPKAKYHFRKELKEADVVIYDGHSSYGGGFGLSSSLYFANPEDTQALDEEMRRENTPEKYQIYYINACHSYGYYPDMFYNILSKKHPGNLDIITTINAASFADSVKTDVKLVSLLTALVPRTTRPEHRPKSWVEIVTSLNAGLSYGALYGVHGIADNPRVAYGEGRPVADEMVTRRDASTSLEAPKFDLSPAMANLMLGSLPGAARPASFWSGFGKRALYRLTTPE